MTLKLTLLFMLTIAGTVIGLIPSKRLTRRRRYFEELISFINMLIGDFKFRQNSVAELVGSFESAELKPTLNEFTAYASGVGDKLELTRRDLSEREFIVVKEMFSALGTYDLDTQVFMLDNYKQKAEEFYAAAKEKELKYGKTYVKLGLLFGLAAGLILL